MRSSDGDMSATTAALIAFFLGTMISVYMPMNGGVSRITGSPLLANVVFYFIAFSGSAAMLFALGGHRAVGKLRDVPPVLFAAGLMSSVMVLATIILLPKLGARKLFLAQVAGQILMAIVVAHFGLLGTPRDALTVKKIAGALLLIAGTIVSVL